MYKRNLALFRFVIIWLAVEGILAGSMKGQTWMTLDRCSVIESRYVVMSKLHGYLFYEKQMRFVVLTLTMIKRELSNTALSTSKK